MATIMWFRNDLRIEDNPALSAAVDLQEPIIPVFVWPSSGRSDWSPGGASKWWLHQSLNALDQRLRELGSRMTYRSGPPSQALPEIVRDTGAQRIFWNDAYEPDAMASDAEVKHLLHGDRTEVETFPGNVLFEPPGLLNKQGRPFQVFTPFWKHCLTVFPPPADPLPQPGRIPKPHSWPESASLTDFRLEPTIDWAGGLRQAWTPGESGAHDRLEKWFDSAVTDYSKYRDFPSENGVSRLSPHLCWGEISPRQVWQRGLDWLQHTGRSQSPKQPEPFMRQLGWREFAIHLLYHFPNTPSEPLREVFRHFPWNSDTALLNAWQQGKTGYPIVDAGMSELWATGYMHNRVRMIVASFLTKDLLIPWQAGAKWFWDTLVDADLANNTLGWQWTAGCGADAAPYFRIFNPVTQGTKFDASGTYVRKWVPSLRGLPDRWIHCPWEAPEEVLREAHVELGVDYPNRIVDHSAQRTLALEAYERIKNRISA